MDILLPLHSGERNSRSLKNARQITVIGANGSGKTRFCNQIMRLAGDKAFRLCAMKAIFAETHPNEMKGSIADIFNGINQGDPLVKCTAVTEFDKLTHVMLAEEFHEMMAYKARLLMGEETPFPKTKLDKTVHMWQQVFPKNKILRANGKILFSTEGQDDQYDAYRLSDGEKAVLYYIGAVQYAMPGALILVDDPESFIHHSVMTTLWNVIEEMRPDCTFIYNTHDLDFASSRIDNQCVWVRSYDPAANTWDYDVTPTSSHISESVYLDILGSRKPVLFIEGDDVHSIDGKLYPLIFSEYTVKPLGSCNKVIESVRTFNDLQAFHHLNSWGIVDRDRRTESEVQYLRNKKILVPNVAEVENLLLMEGVIRAAARYRKRNEDHVFASVKRVVLSMFEHELKAQALQHVRHQVKRNVEVRIDKRFVNIGALENHMVDLVNEINPRGLYESVCRDFRTILSHADYSGVLRVYNQKEMLGECNIAALLGLESKHDYIKLVLTILKTSNREAQAIRGAIKAAFNLTDEQMKIEVKQ